MTSEICANCGHVESEHRNGEVFHIVGNAGVRISKCKKFKPQKETNVQRFGDAILISPKPQNHSPKSSKRIHSPCTSKDTEPEGTRGNPSGKPKASGSDNICSCGHEERIHIIRGKREVCYHIDCKCKQFKPRNDVCKEVNKIEKNFNNKINKLKKEHGKD